MLFLIRNVMLHFRNFIRSYAERALTVLPLEFRRALPNPPRRIGFEIADHLRHVLRRRQPEQQMDMIRHASGNDQFHPNIPPNPTHISK